MPQASVAQGDEDPLSPSVLIKNYLASQGLQPTGDNVRMALSRNARDTGSSGADPVSGLRNYNPSVGQGGSAAREIEQGSPTNAGRTAQQQRTSGPGYVDSGSMDDNVQRPSGTASSGTAPTSSAAPSSGMNIGNIGAAILGAGAGAGGLYGLSRLRGAPDVAPMPGAAAAPPVDPYAQPPPLVNDAVQPPVGNPEDQYRTMPDELQADPMQRSMTRAVEPAAPLDLSGIRPGMPSPNMPQGPVSPSGVVQDIGPSVLPPRGVGGARPGAAVLGDVGRALTRLRLR